MVEDKKVKVEVNEAKLTQVPTEYGLAVDVGEDVPITINDLIVRIYNTLNRLEKYLT